MAMHFMSIPLVSSPVIIRKLHDFAGSLLDLQVF